MKACINPKCFWHVDVVIVEELSRRGETVKVAYCAEGFKNRLKFIPKESEILHGVFCPTCEQAGMICIAKRVGHELRKEKELRNRPVWKKVQDWFLTIIKNLKE